MDKPTGMVTFLFTDIEGSTKLAQEFPETLPAALDKHNALMREAAESNNGFVFEIVGDAFCCAFQNADDAVKAAVMIQRNLAFEKWDDAVIKIRIGIHRGKAVWSGAAYRGYITLAQTNRILSAAYGEQILISNGTCEMVKDKISNEISFRSLGERRLKDLNEPVKLYQIVSVGLRQDFPPLKTLDARPNNLPVQLNSFIGREEEMKKIKNSLINTHLLTLTGPGGTGKTRLALQIAADIIDDFANGVWFVELASLNEPELLPHAVMQALGVQEQPKLKVESTLFDYLKDKELLIILDNCEHIVHDCAKLAEKLLQNSPKLKIFATSREALRCNGELTHQTLSLNTPGPKEKISAATLTQYESVRLFIERALAVNSSFTVNNNNAPAIAGICSQLDGIPLAVELAAARTKVLTAEKIYARLNDRFKLLTGGKRTALPRQQTLSALIDWSYELLSDNEKTLWNRLSVFSGGWTLEASEKICSDEKIISEEEILELLNNLTEKSIVIFNIENQRYKMLETIKKFGDEKMRAANEQGKFSKKHSRFYIELAENASKNLRGNESLFWMNVLNNESGNVEMGLIRSLENSDNEAGARLAVAVAHYWQLRGNLSEGMRWLEAVAKNNTETMNSNYCKVNYFIGKFARLKGDFEKAKNFLQESLEFWRESGNEQGITDTLNSLGINEYDQGRYEQAAGFYEENLEIYKKNKNKRGIAVSLNNLGNVVSNQGDYVKAFGLYEESLTIRRELEDIVGIGITLNNLGILAYEQGDYVKATDLLQESLQIRREIGDINGVAICMMNLGNILYNQGEYISASNLYEEGLQIFREMGDKSGVADAINNLGKVLLEQNETDHALKLFEESIAIGREIGAESQIAVCLYYLGRVAFIKNQHEQARKNYYESLEIYNKTGNKKDNSLNILRIAELQIRSGYYNQAVRLLGFIQREYFESHKIKFPKVDQIIFDESISRLKENLGEEEFLKCFEAGSSMTLEQTIIESDECWSRLP